MGFVVVECGTDELYRVALERWLCIHNYSDVNSRSAYLVERAGAKHISRFKHFWQRVEAVAFVGPLMPGAFR